jgi:hypothetical protein
MGRVKFENIHRFHLSLRPGVFRNMVKRSFSNWPKYSLVCGLTGVLGPLITFDQMPPILLHKYKCLVFGDGTVRLKYDDSEFICPNAYPEYFLLLSNSQQLF